MLALFGPHRAAQYLWPLDNIITTTISLFPSLRLLSRHGCWVAPVGPVSAPREGAILARSPLYPLLPGALVRLMVTKGARAFADALLSDG